MKSNCKTIYKICRNYTGMSQEEVLSYLFISARSLSDYETGRTIPSEDIVCRMVEVYGAPQLAYLHLKQNTEVGRRYLPDICLNDLPRAVLKLQKEASDMIPVEKDLVSIACDGEIDNAEIPLWERAKEELQELVGAALAVLYTERKRPLKAAR